MGGECWFSLHARARYTAWSDQVNYCFVLMSMAGKPRTNSKMSSLQVLFVCEDGWAWSEASFCFFFCWGKTKNSCGCRPKEDKVAMEFWISVFLEYCFFCRQRWCQLVNSLFAWVIDSSWILLRWSSGKNGSKQYSCNSLLNARVQSSVIWLPFVVILTLSTNQILWWQTKFWMVYWSCRNGLVMRQLLFTNSRFLMITGSGSWSEKENNL